LQIFDIDGTMTLRTVYQALGSDLWDAAGLSTGPHASTYASERKDGHGRSIRATERAHSGSAVQARHVLTSYSPPGQPEVITRRLGATSVSDVTRWMRYDSLGRMVLNVDPHTSSGPLSVPSADFASDDRPADLLAWAYQYNQAGDLIATEDARQCGVNFAHDALGRLLGEDYVPCDGSPEAYSDPNTCSRQSIRNSLLAHQGAGALQLLDQEGHEVWISVDRQRQRHQGGLPVIIEALEPAGDGLGSDENLSAGSSVVPALGSFERQDGKALGGRIVRSRFRWNLGHARVLDAHLFLQHCDSGFQLFVLGN
jgi:hypothetical protein